MSAPLPRSTQLREQLIDILDERPDVFGSGDDVASRVDLARVWLGEQERQATQLQALEKPTPQEKNQLRLIGNDIKYYAPILSKYQELLRASVRCRLVIPTDGAVYRHNGAKDGDRSLKDIVIKNARFADGAAKPGMRFEVPARSHVILSESIECSTLHTGCELAEADSCLAEPPAFVTVISIDETTSDVGGSEVKSLVVRVRASHVKLLPPPNAFGPLTVDGKTVEMMGKKDFQYWMRMEAADEAAGGWSEDKLKHWFASSQAERCCLACSLALPLARV
jgi:hypothetical protein